MTRTSIATSSPCSGSASRHGPTASGSTPNRDDRRTDLVFDGIDGFATITLNETTLGRAENQHRTYRFDVSGLLDRLGQRAGDRLRRPGDVRSSGARPVGDLPNPYGTPYNFVRKMACNFGWDWGPQLTTSGLWRPVRLEALGGRPDHMRSVRHRGCRPRPPQRASPVTSTWSSTWMSTRGTTLRRQCGHGHVAGRRHRRAQRGRADRRRQRRHSPSTFPTSPLVAGRVRRPAAVPSSTSSIVDGDACYDHTVRTVGFRTVSLDTSELPDGARVRIPRQRRTDLGAWRQLDPRRLLPGAQHRRARRRPSRRGGGGERQPRACLGRRRVRERLVLRRVRPPRATGVAGLPVCLRRLPRGAAQRRDHGRGRRQHHPPDAAPEPGAVVRQQRMPARMVGLGVAATSSAIVRGATGSTVICSRTSSPPSTPAARTSTGRRPPSTRRSRRTEPTAGQCTCGTCGTASTTSTIERTGPGSSPSSASRRHRPPPRSLRRSRPGRSRVDGAELQHHQKADDGDGKLRRALVPPLRRGPRLRRLAVPHAGQSGQGDRCRHRALPRPARALLRSGVVATRRLLAVDQLGGCRPRRAAQAELVRLRRRVRRPPGRPPPERRSGGPRPRAGQRQCRGLGGGSRGAAPSTGRRRPRRGRPSTPLSVRGASPGWPCRPATAAAAG